MSFAAASCKRLAPSVCGGGAARTGRHASSVVARHARSYTLNTRVVQGGDTEYREPLIFLHGLLGSQSNLAPLVRDPRVKEGRKCLLMDVRNHGASPHDDDVSYDALVEDVMETLWQHSRFGRCTVIGHSYGGKIAINAALRYPDEVSSIVSIDVAPVVYEWQDDDPLSVANVVKMTNELDLRQFGSRNAALEELTNRIGHEGIVGFVGQNIVSDPESGGLKWRLNLPLLAASMDEIRGFVEPPEEPSDVPATFISGGRSEYVGPQHWPAVHQHFSNAHIEVVEGTGHWVHSEKPQEVVRILLEHLDRA